MEPIKAYISVLQQPVSVRHDSDRGCYNCLNTTGHQVCFECSIYNDDKDKTRTWSNSLRNPLGNTISSFLPICLFYGKKEGDEVELKFKDKHDVVRNVVVKLNQTPGKFEEVLYERISGFGGLYDPSNENDPSRMTQYCFIITAHNQYAHSIGKRTIDPCEFRFSLNWITCCKTESEKQPKLSYGDKIMAALDDVTADDPGERLRQAMDKVAQEKN